MDVHQTENKSPIINFCFICHPPHAFLWPTNNVYKLTISQCFFFSKRRLSITPKILATPYFWIWTQIPNENITCITRIFMAFTILIHGVQTTLIGFASRYQVLDLTNSNDKLMFLSYQQCFFILGHSASSTNTTHIKMHIFAYKKLYYGYQFDQTIKKKI